MEENVTNKIPLKVDISTPSPIKQKRQNKSVTKNAIKNRKSLERNTQTPTKKSIKRNTVTGDQYQRILQILIRHRSIKTQGVMVGSDVSDIFDLDDIVCYKEKSCKFFQIKHSTIPISTAHLFKSDFEDNRRYSNRRDSTGSLGESPQSPSNSEGNTRKINCNLHLALYFKGFVHIKENSQFEHCEIEGLYFVTNNSLKEINTRSKNYNNFLIHIENGFQDDKLLYLKGTKADIYSLNVESVKESFNDFLKKEYKKFKKIEDLTSNQLNIFEGLVNEFLTKIRLVMNYPDIETVRDITMKEIFGEDIEDPNIINMLANCIMHMECELLRCTNEYLTSKEWKSNIDRVKSLIEKLSVTGIAEYEKKRLTWTVGDLRFENESMNEMFEDLNIFLEKSDCRVLHLCEIENVELTVVKVLNLLNCKNLCSDYFIYCSLEGLVSTNKVIDYFLRGNSKLLVIACCNENIDYNLKEMVNEIEKSFHESDKKYVFISQTDIFKTYMDTSNNPIYYKKQYRNGFKALNEYSKHKILNKIITFQGKPISLGLIFQNSKDFAERVIDESCLWEIINPSLPCAVSNTDAFSSVGYNEEYYIPRKFHQEKEFLNEEVKGIPKNENDMIQLLDLKKTVILVGNSGEGKSTVLTHIANLLKKQHNDMWFVRVNLRIFFSKYNLNMFGDLTKVQYATDMAFKMAFPNEHNRLEEMLFKKGLQLKQLKVIILLDGFNEVDSKTRNKICAFVKTIRLIDSIVQCWITTQIQYKTQLEERLYEESYFLEPLGDLDQINFMVKYWKVEYARRGMSEPCNVLDLKKDASSALNSWKEQISEESEKPFTSVSLNLKILADILLENNRRLDQQLNLLDLYDKFVKYKFLCYSTEMIGYCNSCSRSQALDSAKENLFAHSVHKVLQFISARRIILQFFTDTTEFPGMGAYEKFKDRVYDNNEENAEVSLLKIGLLTFKNGNIELSHESYVQFFFSKYIVDYCHSEIVQHFLMNYVLVENSFQLCRIFIDGLFFNHMKNRTGVSQRRSIDQIKLSQKAQASFIKIKQSDVVIEENLLNIIQFVLSKLTIVNYKIFFKRVVKHSLKSLKLCIKSYTNAKQAKLKLRLVEEKLNSISHIKILKLLKLQNMFSSTINSRDEVGQKIDTILHALDVINGP